MSEALTHVKARFEANSLTFTASRDDAGVYYGTCPKHRTQVVRFDLDVVEDKMLVHIGPCGCLPHETIRQLGLERVEPHVPVSMRGRLAEQRLGVRTALAAADSTADPYDRITAALEAAGLSGSRSDLGAVRGEGRYTCPACGAPGDGHGLHVRRGKTKPVDFTCYGCGAGEEILTALSLSWVDIGFVPKDDLSWIPDGRAAQVRDTNTSSTRSDPAAYFTKDGLLVASLADDILAMGPLAHGLDDVVWSYHDGVWVQDKHAVRGRAAHLLGERYRRGHGVNAEDVVRARVVRIDCDPIAEVINFRNGLYYWRLDELREHTPDVLSTVQLAVDWNPDATCPEFTRFLAEVVPMDMVDPVMELIGYLMFSGNPLHKAVMLMGNGRNGKGTLLRVIVALLGERNITSVSLHDLVNTRFSTASLFGKIANIAGDIDGSYLENTATFKAITGGDSISAEHKGRDRFDFTPWAVPVFSANKVPPSADTTVGYLSRWFVVPFPNDFSGREDRRLDARLQTKAELQGVAVAGIAALRRLMARGDFDMPASATAARDEFARRVDQVRAWVDDCCDVGEHQFQPRTELYRAYTTWADRDGHKAVRASEFYDRLAAIAGVTPHRLPGVGTRGFVGIDIVDDARVWGRS